MPKHLFYFLWAGWFLYFGIVEGIAIWNEVKNHRGDGETLTHFVSSQIPMGVRIALLAWLVYHFVWVHKHG